MNGLEVETQVRRASKAPAITVIPSSGNVFADLEFAEPDYPHRICYIRFVGTHPAYSRIDATKV